MLRKGNILSRRAIAIFFATAFLALQGFCPVYAVPFSHSAMSALTHRDTLNKYPDADLEAQKAATKGFIIPIESFNGYAGTYGELRGNHFHCGLDMRTAGVVGKKIFAADDGYVSRISISAWGFGNMITITHPNGYKTIYGHLLSLAPKYQKLLREKQYEQKSWAQELDFGPDEYPVKKGELIAYSGNSGSSGGPHLHLEVRDERGVPVNLQLSGTYKITDEGKPVIRDVKFVGCIPLGDAYYKFPVTSSAADAVIDVPLGFYVAVDAYDYKDANSGKLAVYKYDIFIDDDLFFSFEEGNIPYDKGRYIASLLDLRLRLETGRYYIKTQLDPGNLLSDRIFARKGGVCTLRDTLEHSVKVTVTDVCGNSLSKSYKVKCNPEKFATAVPSAPSGILMEWGKKNVYNGGDFNLTIPEGALYSNFYFTSSRSTRESSVCPTVWKVGDRNVPLHRAAILELKYPLPDSLASKAVIARVTEKGRLNASGGKYNKLTQSIIGEVSSLGNYTIAIDVTLPKITFKFKEKAKIAGKSVKIAIGDNLSGVESFEVKIDGHWVVAEYDGKSSTLEVPLADARIARGKTHTIEVEVTDAAGNRAREARKFIW